MIICILCPNANIAAVRESAKQIPAFASHTALAIPVSANGHPPVSHWFCTFNASEEVFQQIKALQDFTEVIESEPRPFLTTRNLKVIPGKEMREAE